MKSAASGAWSRLLGEARPDARRGSSWSALCRLGRASLRPRNVTSRPPASSAAVCRSPFMPPAISARRARCSCSFRRRAVVDDHQSRAVRQPMKAGDVIVEFDPSDQEFALEQAEFDLQLAEQEIV